MVRFSQQGERGGGVLAQLCRRGQSLSLTTRRVTFRATAPTSNRLRPAFFEPGCLFIRAYPQLHLPREESLPKPSLLFSFVQEGGGDERTGRTQAELGRLLAAAGGYRVLASDGTHLGWLDHVRYERHVDHPDAIIVRSRRLFARRRRVLPFSAVADVGQRDRKVVVRGTRTE